MKKHSVVFTLAILIAGLTEIQLYSYTQKNKKSLLKVQKEADKYKGLMHLLDKWLMKKQRGKKLTQYFEEKGIDSIAIYGMSYIGERLYDELKDSDIEIRYAIDQNINGVYTDLNVFLPKDELPEVDAIIVTPVFYYDEIKEVLKKKVGSKIISLDTVLNKI